MVRVTSLPPLAVTVTVATSISKPCAFALPMAAAEVRVSVPEVVKLVFTSSVSSIVPFVVSATFSVPAATSSALMALARATSPMVRVAVVPMLAISALSSARLPAAAPNPMEAAVEGWMVTLAVPAARPAFRATSAAVTMTVLLLLVIAPVRVNVPAPLLSRSASIVVVPLVLMSSLMLTPALALRVRLPAAVMLPLVASRVRLPAD